jgi:voltage-dependent potassium channel beta subunit
VTLDPPERVSVRAAVAGPSFVVEGDDLVDRAETRLTEAILLAAIEHVGHEHEPVPTKEPHRALDVAGLDHLEIPNAVLGHETLTKRDDFGVIAGCSAPAEVRCRHGGDASSAATLPRMAQPAVNSEMEYRRLGATGLKVSVLSFGSWVTFDTQLDDSLAIDCMAAAGDAGCNFFDNAEAYAGGESEAIMGRAFQELGWPRWSYVLTTKVFFGIHTGVPNMGMTLNRKYLLQAIDGCLERLQTDFIDVLYCHRYDRDTPMEEVVWAMSDIVSSGKATYWGTSEWSAAEIREAIEIAERHHLHKPVTEQSQYNLIQRSRVDEEYADLTAETGYGNTIWSPLASGLLTGKYRDGIPEDSRLALDGYGWLAKSLNDEEVIARIERLRPIADRLDCTMAQLALAWCTTNPAVSTVITGASKVEQVVQNFETLAVIPELTDEVRSEMEAAVAE